MLYQNGTPILDNATLFALTLLNGVFLTTGEVLLMSEKR